MSRRILLHCLSPAPGIDTIWGLCMKREQKLRSDEKWGIFASIRNGEIRGVTIGLVLMTGNLLRYCGLEDGVP